MLTETIYTQYHSFSLEDLLQDDFFIHSMINKTLESENFWHKMLHEEKVDPENYKAANCFINIFQVEPKTLSSEEISSIQGKIEDSICQNKRKEKYRLKLCLSFAASIAILLICTLMLYYLGPYGKLHEDIANVKIPQVMTDNIRLILADSETVSLEGNEAHIIYDNEEIIINDQQTQLKNEQTNFNKSVAYNQIIVPFGKRSMLTLNEGSRIWINAGTRVVYPVKFAKDYREIYVDGEAYLEVANEQGKPFIVKTKKLEVEVLGTSFSISSYEIDAPHDIVLVSGSVKVNSDIKNEVILLPNQMYSYSGGLVSVKSVKTDNYVSWISGFYQYESEQLSLIMKRLSHYYGKVIECSPEVVNLKCSGKLDLKDNIELVLNGISKTVPVKWICDNDKYSIIKQ